MKKNQILRNLAKEIDDSVYNPFKLHGIIVGNRQLIYYALMVAAKEVERDINRGRR